MVARIGDSIEVLGDLTIRDLLKAYRLRRSGSALDLEFGGASLYLSGWTGADFTGTQSQALIVDPDGKCYFQQAPSVPTPTAPAHAVRKDYVDGLVGTPPAPGTGLVSGTVTPDANLATTKYNYTFSTDITLAVPTGGVDTEVIEFLFSNVHGAGSTRVITLSPLYYGGPGIPTSVAVPDGGEAYIRIRRSDIGPTPWWFVEYAAPMSLLTTMIEYVGSSGWVTGTASLVNQFPKGLRTGDIVYAVVHSRESATVLPAIANWTSVYTAVLGGGTVADSTGPTRVTFLKRVVGAGGLSGTNTFGTLGTTVAASCLHVYRPRYGATITEAGCFVARATASQLTGGTTDVIALQAGDQLIGTIGTPDDTANPLSISGMTVSGNVTQFSAPLPAPHGSFSSAGGNDMSCATWVNEVIGGSSNLGIIFEGFADTSETGGFAALRIRAA